MARHDPKPGSCTTETQRAQRRTENHPPRDPLTNHLIGLAIGVHRELGPGLLESAYEECLCFELKQNGIAFARQAPLSITYKGIRLDCGYRLDIVVQDELIIEVKAVDHLLKAHPAVPGRSICSMRVPCAGDQRRAGTDRIPGSPITDTTRGRWARWPAISCCPGFIESSR